MIENHLVKSLYNFITQHKDVDSDYWYFGGNIVLIGIFKNFNAEDIKYFELQILKWNSEIVEILIDCFIYGNFDEVTSNKQCQFLTFLLANLKNEDIKLELLENASDFILNGEPKPIELLDSIINWIKKHKYDEIYSSQSIKIYEAKRISIEKSKIKQKINELRKEIFSLTKTMQAFNEIDGIQDSAIYLLKNFNYDDFEQLKIDLLLWSNNELEILAKFFSRGDKNGNIINDNYFYGYIFVLLPVSISSTLLEDMFYFFENQKIDFELLQKIKSKLNELIAKRFIETDTYEYWSKEILEKQKTCS